MREDKADCRQLVEIELVHDGLEVVSVGTQAVEPDDGALGRIGGLTFDDGKQLAIGCAGGCLLYTSRCV